MCTFPTSTPSLHQELVEPVLVSVMLRRMRPGQISANRHIRGFTLQRQRGRFRDPSRSKLMSSAGPQGCVQSYEQSPTDTAAQTSPDNAEQLRPEQAIRSEAVDDVDPPSRANPSLSPGSALVRSPAAAPLSVRQGGRESARQRGLTWDSAANNPLSVESQQPVVGAAPYAPEPEQAVSHAARADQATPRENCNGGEAAAGVESQEGQGASQGRQGQPSSADAAPIPRSFKQQAVADRTAIADKLIAVFEQRSTEEWRKLIAFSKQWPALADGVFDRMEMLSQQAEDPARALELRRLSRRLKSVHTELSDYNQTIAKFREAPPEDWEALVGELRAQLPADFFEHLENVIRAVPADEVKEREDLLNLMARVLALVSVYDQMAANEAALDTAVANFEDLLQVESIQEADAKIDALAASGQLDPALLLTMAKAYAASKDTDVTREEVKDIMAHLYFKAKESFAKMQPPEVRILKHLLSVDDPLEREAGLRDAFTPGADLETNSQDFLSTTPDKLMGAIEAVLEAYESSRGQTSMLGQASELMRPDVIMRLRELRDNIRKHYM
eukprot:jgi/Botrbrau1/11764/Bobra.0195s0089.1